ncbi:DUF732 domain-containing protein [Mycobacterium sp. 21AC1]|uniref:DUF732 domain-containing protein n=1 Tax=[Mycobacterium] appelbergii TaxID=2939269 RepID=UPI0029394794|nr:DUF732 domain-containing protein [Mycobacterium sp. 21AC1]MDV3128350.1 DUF732 domain-containing protein [Mycobacterium sp. 21AC1]
MTCPYCGSDTGGTSSCDRCGQLHARTALSGWRPDPTARHEGRYYAAGRPTNRVRDGRSQGADPAGGRLLPDYVELPTSRSSIRSSWIATGAVTAIIVMVAAVVGARQVESRRTGPSPEAGYVSALDDAGLMAQFNSEANAVAHGKLVCRQLEGGQPQQGLPTDKIAVDIFCPHFSQGFHVLETATVKGTFVLADHDGLGGIVSDGAACQGAGGYSDVNGGTAVTVKNGKGEILASTTLGAGKGGTADCRFSFTLKVTEGQDHYVVSVGHRGEFDYTFDQLMARSVQMRLGG